MPRTFKNPDDGTLIDIPLLGLRVAPGDTFEVPDEFADQFDVNPAFTATRRKHGDHIPDPTVVDTVTGPIPTSTPPTVTVDDPDFD